MKRLCCFVLCVFFWVVIALSGCSDDSSSPTSADPKPTIYAIPATVDTSITLSFKANQQIQIVTTDSVNTNPDGPVVDCDLWTDADGSGEACFLARNTRLVWLAYTPIIFGMLAIVAASAYTTVLASQSIPAADKEWRPQFLTRIKLLQKSFYLLSLVLVTSTVTILYFTSLPQDLLADAQLKNVLSKLFGGLTAFWGGLFTATLFATFLPAVILFIQHTRHHQIGATATPGLAQWLYESVFVSIKKQAFNVLMIIAPMLVGPFSDLLRNISGLSG